MRREFSRKTKAAAFLRANGHCQDCTAPLAVGKFEFHHADGDATNSDVTNCRVLCVTCHAIITHQEQAPRRAKAKRQRDRHIGAKKAKQPFRGWRRFNGEVVWRDK